MKSFLLVALAAVLFCSGLHAQDPVAAESTMKKLLAAKAAKDYDAFVADGTDQLKAALTKTQFEAAANLINAKTKDGYELIPLGELNQRGFEVYLYRLRFKSGGDDMLATLSLKDGKVGGIVFR